jgi:hypothetical protein
MVEPFDKAAKPGAKIIPLLQCGVEILRSYHCRPMLRETVRSR